MPNARKPIPTNMGPGDPDYPPALGRLMGRDAPEQIAALGNLEILKIPMLALFCSVRCPGELILKTYDLFQELRKRSVIVIGGFHSPMEKECLNVLLRGVQPVVICPARSLEKMRIPVEWRPALDQDRLLLLSPFPETIHRATVGLAAERNLFVAALAAHVFVAYADPGGKTEDFCRKIIALSIPVLTLESSKNANLFALGAKPVETVLDELEQ